MKEQPSLIKCKDGSHTLFSKEYNQHYHNPNGAVKESLYIFFEANGLRDALKDGRDFSVLEVGFGTGLNLMLLADMHQSIGSSSKVTFYSVESNLIAPETADKMNYTAFLKYPPHRKVFTDFFKASPGFNNFSVTKDIQLNLFNGLFEIFQIDSLQADFILHDAFSPGVNAELWSIDAFTKLRAHSSEIAVLSTYSSAVKARDAMARGGWVPTRITGVLGKREMTIARAR